MSLLWCSCQNVSHEPSHGHAVRQVQVRDTQAGAGEVGREGEAADGTMLILLSRADTHTRTLPALFSTVSVKLSNKPRKLGNKKSATGALRDQLVEMILQLGG